jgi:Arc/MetJ-type ribon-helix-helix transcriptional regulator
VAYWDVSPTLLPNGTGADIPSVTADYDSYMNKKVPITVTLDPRLREWAEHLVATGKAPSVSAVINDALTVSYSRHKRGLALLRERAEQGDEERVARMRAHIDAQAAALGLNDA